MCNVKVVSLLIGVGLIGLGLLGFMPMFIKEGNLLFGLFLVDAMHNSLYIVTGALSIISARMGYIDGYFKLLGVVYAGIALAGLMRAGDVFFMHVNMADSMLHMLLALLALFYGFCSKKCSS